MQFELSKEFLEQVEHAVDQQEKEFVIENLSELHAADLNLILTELNTVQSKYIIDLLDVSLSAEIISELDSDIRQRFLKNFNPKELTEIIEEVDSDDAADILNEQTLKVREEVLSLIRDTIIQENILELLRYEEDCAGGMMAKELIKANVNWTVNQCIEEIKRQAEKVDKIYSIYVVNDQDKLLGRVSLKKILLTPSDSKIEHIYEDDVLFVDVFTEDDEVAQIMSKYDLEAIPVLNIQRKLVGRITIDDIVDVITEHAETERNLMSGISENVEHSDSIWELTRARLPWLLIGVVGGLLSAMLMGVFENQMTEIVAVAFFIPLITATGGNVGIQSSSIVVQSLATKSAFNEDISMRLWKSFVVSIMNGIAISGAVFLFVFTFLHDPNLAFVVSIAIFSVVILSSLIGTITPLILDKFDINPAVASGPFITTTNDILGIAVYFFVVNLLLVI